MSRFKYRGTVQRDGKLWRRYIRYIRLSEQSSFMVPVEYRYETVNNG